MDSIKPPRGHVCGYYVSDGDGQIGGRPPALPPHVNLPGIWTPFCAVRPNLVMFDQAVVAANLFTGRPEFKVSVMYFEFKNVADPEDEVAVPTYDRSGGATYYAGLDDVEDVDYLRVAVIASTVTSSGEDYPLGNVATYYGQTSGVTGVHGTTFSDTVNSKVYGAALVATPNFADTSQDLIVSRFYWPTDQQQIKLPSSQVGVSWPLTFQ